MALATAPRALSNAPGQDPPPPATDPGRRRELSCAVLPEASRLADESTRRVAVVVPRISRWFSAQLEALEPVLRRDGLRIPEDIPVIGVELTRWPA